MKRYRVEFSHTAECDLIDSIVWGIENWGEEATFRWVRELRHNTLHRLSIAPFAQPIAPESALTRMEIRQLILGRYRVLYEISGKTVNILHIRGPFSGTNE